MTNLIAQEGTDIGTFGGLGGFQPDKELGFTDAPTQLSNLISTTIGAITIIVGISFLLYFFVGAFQWAISGGDKTKLEQARDRITSAIIGLIITIAAYALTGLIGSLFGLDILNLEKTLCLIQNPTSPIDCNSL